MNSRDSDNPAYGNKRLNSRLFMIGRRRFHGREGGDAFSPYAEVHSDWPTATGRRRRGGFRADSNAAAIFLDHRDVKICPTQRPRRRLALLCAAVAAVLLTVPSMALDPRKAITQYVHTAWTSQNGLPQNVVFSIAQTHDGYVWLATEEGVARFDGVRFQVFDISNSAGLGDNTVSQLEASRDGGLWMGTRSGLTHYRNGVFHTDTVANGLAANDITALHEGADASLWIGTIQGLNRLQDGRFQVYTQKDGLPDNRVTAIAEDRNGSLWVGTKGGLARFDAGRFRAYTHTDGLPDNFVTALAASQDGALWVGTSRGALVRWAKGVASVWAAQNGPPTGGIASLLEDRDGNLWISYSRSGIGRLTHGTFSWYRTHDGLPSDNARALFEDREGNLWISLYEAGALELTDGKFTSFGTPEGLSSDLIAEVLGARDGSIWVGTLRDGVNRLKDGRVERYSSLSGLPNDVPRAFAEGSDGTIWIGEEKGWLSRLRKGHVTAFHDQVSKDYAIYAILEDHQGNLWIGTNGAGIARFHDGRFEHLSAATGLPQDTVIAMTEDRDGTLWIGTDGAGVQRLRDGKITTYAKKDGLLSDFVTSIQADRDGAVWIGTASGGLNRLKDGRITSYAEKQGLFSTTVGAIVDDELGNLWMSSNKGIFYVPKQELNDFADGRISVVHSVAYGVADGLRSPECNYGTSPSGWRSQDGWVWFPTIAGLAAIDPRHIRSNPLAPPVWIERLSFDNHNASIADGMRLGPGFGGIEIQFTAPSFVAPARVQFRYRLEGFDRDWVDAGTRRTAYYTNLPPGRYTFQVQVANSDGVWNRTGASLEFELRPHFYQTTWFYTLCGLLLALGGWKIYLLRLRFLLRRNQELETRVLERTNELQEQVRAKEEANAQLAEAQQHLMALSRQAGMAEVAVGVLHNVGNVLNSVNVSATIVANKIRESRIGNLLALVGMLQEHSGELPDFLNHDPKGQRVVPYLAKLGSHLEAERQVMLRELELLTGHIGHIKEIVATQQNYASVSGLIEVIALPDLVEDAIRIIEPGLSEHGIHLERDHEALPPVAVDKHSVLQILLNLLHNAKQAVKDSDHLEKNIRVRVSRWGEDRIRIAVEDTGVGLAPENLTRIFSHGFTTRRDGHGFGLHSGANAAHRMGGALWAESDGLGRGATFTLELPLSARETARETQPV
jgi:ligand-binding sensor domain-containing protein/signal transduction histidine kinase